MKSRCMGRIEEEDGQLKYLRKRTAIGTFLLRTEVERLRGGPGNAIAC